MSCPNKDEFERQYNLAYAFAMVAKELANLLNEKWLSAAIDQTNREAEKLKLQLEVDRTLNA